MYGIPVTTKIGNAKVFANILTVYRSGLKVWYYHFENKYIESRYEGPAIVGPPE